MTRPFTEAEVRSAARALGIPEEHAVAAWRGSQNSPAPPRFATVERMDEKTRGIGRPKEIDPEHRDTNAPPLAGSDASTALIASEPLTLALPLPGDRANGRMHHMARYRADEATRREADGWPNPAPPAVPFGRVRLEWTVCTVREMDRDNRWARLKPLRDWLVTRGYLAGDTDAHIPEELCHGQPGTKRGATRVLVTITLLEDA